MRYHEFLSRVQAQAGLASQAETINLINVTLEILEKRIYPSQSDVVTAPLSQGFDSLAQMQTELAALRREIDRPTLDKIFKHVSASTNLSYSEAARGVRAVMDILNKALEMN